MDLGALIAGRHLLVTGASGGLGEHFARLFARHGAVVTVAARRKERLDRLVDELRAAGAAQARANALDVADEGSVARVFPELEAAGAPPLDVLVNNAGVADTRLAMDVGAAEFDRILDTNLRGAWLLSVEAARAWRAAKRPGAIVNVASILGLRPGTGVAPYSISKAGLIQMTKSLALEWARFGIRVNALCPGYIGTDINAEYFATDAGKRMIDRIPMRRLGRPEDLDAAVLLLASDASGWMTGSALAVDGGHLVSSL